MNSILEVKNLRKTFDGLLAVSDFSMTIMEYNITSLIGPNGAGKTTLFNIISGFLTAERGSVFFRQKDINGLPPYKIARSGIARTFQDLRLITKLSVLDNVLLSRPNQDGEAFLTATLKRKKVKAQESIHRERAFEVLDFVGLSDKINHLANDLSYGQQKLLSVACCLATEGNLLLLDEPVSGIHPQMIERILNLIKQLVKMNKTIFFIEHNIEAVRQVSDYVIVMDHGQKIAEGLPTEVLNDEKILEAYLE